MVRGGTAFGYDYVSLAHDRLVKRMEPFVFTFPSKIDRHVFFDHGGEEFVFILSGKVIFQVGDERWTLAQGRQHLFRRCHTAPRLERRARCDGARSYSRRAEFAQNKNDATRTCTDHSLRMRMQAVCSKFERNVHEPGNYQGPKIKHRSVCEQRRQQLIDRIRTGKQ